MNKKQKQKQLSIVYREDKVINGGGVFRNFMAKREIETLKMLIGFVKKDLPSTGIFLEDRKSVV